MKQIFFIIAAICFPVLAQSATWYVSQQMLSNIPADKQFTTISAAVTRANSGDLIEIQGGIYRETVNIPKKKNGTAEAPFRLVAATGADVVICGSDVLTNWLLVPGLNANVRSTPWILNFGNPYPNDEYHKLIGRCEQVFIDGEMLRQVLDKTKLASGTFFVDLSAKQLYVYPPAGKSVEGSVVEASTRSYGMKVEADYVHLKGLRFLHAANKAQSGMVEVRNVVYTVVEDCVFERANGPGFTILGPTDHQMIKSEGNNITVRRCEFKDNGQLGFRIGNMSGLLMEDCLITRNNAKGFNASWEAGGNKLMMCKNVVIASSVFSYNAGPGIWFDFGNENCEVKNCLMMGNGTTGLYYEAGYTLHAHDNVSINHSGDGICIASSMDCLIERNIICNNGTGMKYNEELRSINRMGTPATSEDKNPSHWFKNNDAEGWWWIWNAGHIVRNNIFADNTGVQSRGWSDVMETASWKKTSQYSPAIQAIMDGQRETLKIQHENNFFACSGTQRLFRGIFSNQERTFNTLEALWQVRSDLETGSRKGTVAFTDRNALDFRVPLNSEVLEMKCYPRGKVPGVTLLELSDPNSIETVQTAQYQVYPTLVTDNLTITGAENASLCIINISGRVVYSTSRAKVTESVSMGNYPAGVYLVRVNGVATKIIKK